MQAIIVKFHGPTNTKGSRLKVDMKGFKSLEVAFPYEFDSIEAYDYAVKVFCIRNKINYSILVGGEMPKGERVYVFK
jgi:hypothetical protein